MDPLATETSEFWKPRRLQRRRSNQIQTEVFRLPTTCFAEERGSLVSSSRVLQWHWKAPKAGRGEERSGNHVGLFLRMKKAYQKDGGKFPTRSST
jgi:formate dehydrogenase major subunit